MAQSCGKTKVAMASRSTFAPMASCTLSVAICMLCQRLDPEFDTAPTMTAGSAAHQLTSYPTQRN